MPQVSLEFLQIAFSFKAPTRFDGTVSRFERGEREPNLFVILEYARLAKINPVLLIDDQYSVRTMLACAVDPTLLARGRFTLASGFENSLIII